jgi:hypothetical protein
MLAESLVKPQVPVPRVRAWILITTSTLLTLGALLWALPSPYAGSSSFTSWNTRLRPISVAFVGNSITFVNDVPRLMEALSGYTLTQDSCLHGSLNLLSIMTKGNGMSTKWKTENAFVKTQLYYDDSENGDDDSSNHGSYHNVSIYDYGACSFPQLIFGHDESLSPENENGIYIDDGKNPCFENPYYLQYLEERYQARGTPQWDYVVMNDQTKYPALFIKRRRSLLALQQVYGPIFLESGARPVFIATHGYTVQSKRLGDIAQFTSHLWYGYQLYAQTLQRSLPSNQQPLLVPSGLAFLTVYEENEELWERLFYVDGCTCHLIC